MRLTTTLLAASLALAPVTAHAGDQWSGFYLGANAGYVFGDAARNDFFFNQTIDADGAVGGAQAGYNFRHGDWVFGPEVAVHFGSISETESALRLSETTISGPILPFYDVRKVELEHLLTANLRIGRDFGGIMVYATAGLASGKISSEAQTLNGDGSPFSSLFRESARHTGYNVGAGFEMLLAPGRSLGLDYRYVDLGDSSQTSFPPSTIDVDAHVVGARLNILLGSAN